MPGGFVVVWTMPEGCLTEENTRVAVIVPIITHVFVIVERVLLRVQTFHY